MFGVDDIIAMCVIKYLKNKAIDHYTLGKFEDAYENLPDKRRRPGPKLRRVISAMKSGLASDIRDEIKSLTDDCLDLPEYYELGMAMANLL
eukprot:CAMPEP_0114239898 /NCGR_PEP_ID=MMETSP0058-20121206/8724_1 /TAXON_ID=36894 /ORGANISM="Pyramimonas parkeae, CCMP726" /LENGTH=90 /DNA_ID=CAMNT_0001352147 /DNA_START=668 /DNA_END=940 /DNA_ORIENTATION=+